MSCGYYCCFCCSSEEEADTDHNKDKLKGYKQKTGDRGIVPPKFQKVPLQRVFQLSQPLIPLSTHPQLRKESLIKEQPTVSYSLSSKRPSLMEDSTFCYSHQYALPQSYPRLNLRLFYDFQTSSLIVLLVSAKNLPTICHKKGTFKPFVLLFLLPYREDIFRTKSIVDPEIIFEEQFSFDNIPYDEIRERTLVLRVLES